MSNIDQKAAARVIEAIHHDVQKELYDGAVIIVALNGKIALHEAIGFADRSKKRAMKRDDVFYIFSLTKAFTTASILACIDRGLISLTTPVGEVIPEFAVRGKQRITVGQLLTHTSGLPSSPPPIPLEMFRDLGAFVAAVCDQPLDSRPGMYLRYSVTTSHAILGEIAKRLDSKGRTFRQILNEDFFKPLGMQNTALGLRSDLAKRRVPIVVRDQTKGLFDRTLVESLNTLLDESAEIPSGGAVSTAEDMFLWAEMLRGEGTLGNTRVLSKAIVDLAVTNHTGDMPNHLFDYAREMYGWPDFPAFLGLSFFLRGEGDFPTPFGLTASPQTFGSLGAGSTVFWVDPKREITFVCLTSGLMDEAHSIERFQRLSDLAIAAFD